MRKDKAAAVIGGLAVVMLAAGVVLGSVYRMKTGGADAAVEEYLRGFMERLRGGTDARTVFFNALRDNFVCLGLMALSGLFRLGFVLNGALILRKGFVTGYTAAGFLKAFGLKGVLALGAMLPAALLGLSAMLFFGAVSTLYGFNNERSNKRGIMRYIIFAIITGAIFGMASVAEGYLSTIFMNKAALWLL